MQSVLEYYWTKVLYDGSKISQFDETGHLHRWFDDESTPQLVRFDPFSIELAERVMDVNKLAVISLPHKPIEIKICPNDEVVCFWDGGLETSTPYQCDNCGWQWMATAAYEYPVCKQCGNADEFFCEEHQRFIEPERVIRKPTGQLECPDCTHPQGLIRNQHVYQVAKQRHFVEYVCEIKNKLRLTITDQNVIRIESLEKN